MFVLKETASVILSIFCIAVTGYFLGSIRIKGVELGTAALFISGLFFGHFGVSIPAYIQTLGLIFFIASVGMTAGPAFAERVKANGAAYIILCLSIAVTGSFTCILLVKLTGIDKTLAVGMMTGAFTTSPGFAAAKEAVSDSAQAVTMVAAGYGIVYPIGVVGKVFYMQLVPKILNADMEKERELIAVKEKEKGRQWGRNYRQIDTMGLFPFSMAVIGGILLGSFVIPLPGGGEFSLGTTGGPLVVGLLLGHMGHIGPVSLKMEPGVTRVMKEIGLLLFFTGAGAEGGKGLVLVLQTYGFRLLFIGLILLLVPLAAGFVVGLKVLRLPLLNGLGSISASMTCTPSLAILTKVAGTDDVAAAYAATYPFALIALVLAVQVILMVA